MRGSLPRGRFVLPCTAGRFAARWVVRPIARPVPERKASRVAEDSRLAEESSRQSVGTGLSGRLRRPTAPVVKRTVCVVVVAYNAASTLAGVLDRVPESFWPAVGSVLVADDHSSDSTYLVGLGYKQLRQSYPIEVLRHERNLGYGGNQKACYRWAIEHGFDVVVLLHGDGQYAPELLPAMVAPVVEGRADAVFGSRMLIPGAARRGGMPLYKYVGNRILTRVENRLVGTELSEYHSGYRAYATEALARLDLEGCSDGFDFDTEIIIRLHDQGFRMEEIPIPTYYGDEICYVNGLGYAKDVVTDAARYRLARMGIRTAGVGGDSAPSSGQLELKQEEGTSHQLALTWLRSHLPGAVLDVGCGAGHLAALAEAAGHEVTGVDVEAGVGVAGRMTHFVPADLDRGLPDGIGGPFDLVVLADVLEHLRHPETLLAAVVELLRPAGEVFVSVPNFGHWYPRLRTTAGRFDYDDRGIRDRAHARFFTERSFRRLLGSSGLELRSLRPAGLPLERLDLGGRSVPAWLAGLDRAAAASLPGLCAYQFVAVLRKPSTTPPTHGSGQGRPDRVDRAGRGAATPAR